MGLAGSVSSRGVGSVDRAIPNSFVFSYLLQDHITLLLSCHAKVKDEVKLDALLESIALSPAAASAEVGAETRGATGAVGAVGVGAGIFNAEQAISTLQTAGYTAQALKVAARFFQHASYVGIQVGPIRTGSNLAVACTPLTTPLFPMTPSPLTLLLLPR
jgi:hypothetical protein